MVYCNGAGRLKSPMRYRPPAHFLLSLLTVPVPTVNGRTRVSCTLDSSSTQALPGSSDSAVLQDTSPVIRIRDVTSARCYAHQQFALNARQVHCSTVCKEEHAKPNDAKHAMQVTHNCTPRSHRDTLETQNKATKQRLSPLGPPLQPTTTHMKGSPTPPSMLPVATIKPPFHNA